MFVPNESRVCSLKQRLLPELWADIVQPLDGMSDVVAVAIIETRRVQDALYHVQVHIIVRELFIVQMEHASRIWDHFGLY